jgi:hypothetical protein
MTSSINPPLGRLLPEKTNWERYLAQKSSPAALSPELETEAVTSSPFTRIDVSHAKALRANSQAKACFQGQTHGHEGFLLTPEWASGLSEENPKYRDVLYPFLTVDDLLSSFPPRPKRYLIDFYPRQMTAAAKYETPFAIVKKLVLPDREKAAALEQERNSQILSEDPAAKINRHHADFLKQWWLLSGSCEEMLQKINRLPRYIACSYAGKHPILEFVSAEIRPHASIVVFTFADDYSFGILQSSLHATWLISKCSTLTERFRYNPNAVFDTFPWPQSPGVRNARRVTQASRSLRALRRKRVHADGLTFRELIRLLESPTETALQAAQEELDAAVRAAYRMSDEQASLPSLLDLNIKLAALEARGTQIQGPGLPAVYKDRADFISTDRVEIQPLKG